MTVGTRPFSLLKIDRFNSKIQYNKSPLGFERYAESEISQPMPQLFPAMFSIAQIRFGLRPRVDPVVRRFPHDHVP